MKKVVINRCFGGFSLSPKAIKRLAELQGRKCYFFKHGLKTDAYTILNEAENTMFFSAFDIDNPNDLFSTKDWNKMSTEERQAQNALYRKHILDSRPENRECPLLVKVVEELGDEANGQCAKLAIVEIPDNIKYSIEEYDGNEHIAEEHATWR